MLLDMWRQFTREYPARPNRALIGTGLALAVSVGVAYLMTAAPAAGGGVQSLPHWPIVFEVPPGFGRARIANDPWAVTGSPESGGGAVYVREDPVVGGAVLKIVFAVLPSGTLPKDAASELLGQELETVHPVRMGPLSGYLLQPAANTESLHALAVGCSADGLAVAVECTTLSTGPWAEKTILAVCASVAYAD
ncbi:MAG: hypothetical protein ABII12_05730 [Planctomycetota bacterium]